MKKAFPWPKVAACGPGWLWESTGSAKGAKRSGQSWTNDPSKSLPSGSTEVHNPHPRRLWVLGPLTPHHADGHSPPPPPETLVPVWGRGQCISDGTKGQPRSRAVGVDNTTSILLPGTQGLPSLCPLSHAPEAPVSRGEPLPKPQRKYLRPFWATGSLRQPAFFTLKAARNQ